VKSDLDLKNKFICRAKKHAKTAVGKDIIGSLLYATRPQSGEGIPPISPAAT